MAGNAASGIHHVREDFPWQNEIREGLLCPVSLDDIAHRGPPASGDIGWLAPEDHPGVFHPEQTISNMVTWTMSRAMREGAPIGFQLFEIVRGGYVLSHSLPSFWRAFLADRAQGRHITSVTRGDAWMFR